MNKDLLLPLKRTNIPQILCVQNTGKKVISRKDAKLAKKLSPLKKFTISTFAHLHITLLSLLSLGPCNGLLYNHSPAMLQWLRQFGFDASAFLF
jgi:hypothetical protein